jgi:hypothetical protein
MTTLQADADWFSGLSNQVGRERRSIPAALDHTVAILLFLLVSWLLASRQLYTAPDDTSYLSYFDGVAASPSDSTSWEFLIEEPLWALWATTTGYALGAEMAMRATIFLSSFGLLWSASRLSKGAWVFVLLVFILSGHLATQLYFNQIRQGVALTVFLAGLASGRRSGFFLAGIAWTIHSSLTFAFLAMILSVLTKRFSNRNVVAFSVVTAIVALSIKAYIDSYVFVDLLGRRGTGSTFERALNLNYYIVSVSAFAVVMNAVRNFEQSDYLLWRLTWFLYCMAFVASFYHESSGRIFYLMSILYPILLARRFPKRIPVYVLFLMFTAASSLWGQIRDPGDSVLSRWELVLHGDR